MSVTFNTALYVPADVYVNDGFATVESPNVPSPFKSHEYEIVSPASGSDDPEPSKLTANGAFPLVGAPDATAVGGLFPPPDAVYVAVYEASVVGEVMLCVAARPSDQDEKL